MALPDYKTIDTNKAYVVDGPTFREIVRVCGAVANMAGESGIRVNVSDVRILIGTDNGVNLFNIGTVSGNSNGTGLPPNYTWTNFTICANGTPATRWWATWTSNPNV
jgi:hypothetical protein